jgi:hypothetical protein
MYVTASPVGGDQLIQVLLKIGRRQWQAVVHPERRLIERQLPDPDPGRGGVQRQHGTGGEPPDVRRTAC